MYGKTKTWRSAEWLAVVHRVPCVHCGNPQVQAAHFNLGKGKGLKASDATASALCMAQHMEIDQGRQLARQDRREYLAWALVATVGQLLARQYVIVDEPATALAYKQWAEQAIESDDFEAAAEWCIAAIESFTITPNTARLI
jgi:hypothetical protein